MVSFFLTFYKEKPVDWLLDHILWVKVCNPEKDAKHCNAQKQRLKIRFKPSLFQHIGKLSSLKGKRQSLVVSTPVKSVLGSVYLGDNIRSFIDAVIC